MVTILFHQDFQKIFSKIKNKDVKEKILKQISRIKERPEVGKPMKYARIGTREVYIAPIRLSYNHSKEEDKIVVLDLYHKDEQ